MQAPWERRRNARWRHFAYVGQVRMASAAFASIHVSATTSDAAKEQAALLINESYKLLELLEERKGDAA